jgi:hypothetical protein
MLPIFVCTVLDKNQNQPLPNSKPAKLAAVQYQDTFGCICMAAIISVLRTLLIRHL